MAETENFSTVSAEEDAKYGFTRPEMFSTNLGGTVDAYDRHVFLCHKSPAEWASRVEEDLLPKRLSSAFKSRKDDMKLKEIELEAHAVKGIGKTHAKWSPVGTAWYRMLPEVLLLEDVEDDVAEELVRKCPVKVFDIEDIGKGKKRATVKNPRACTLCRECIIGGEEWEKRVALRRVKDHFIWSGSSRIHSLTETQHTISHLLNRYEGISICFKETLNLDQENGKLKEDAVFNGFELETLLFNY